MEREKLCGLIEPGTIHGRTTKLFQEKTGLADGTPLISAGGDQQCAAVGQGVIGPGTMEITVGTEMCIRDSPHSSISCFCSLRTGVIR